MTNEERNILNQRLKTLSLQYKSMTPKEAADLLKEKGLLTEDGQLHPDYGGVDKRNWLLKIRKLIRL